jgi:hypothetical protein
MGLVAPSRPVGPQLGRGVAATATRLVVDKPLST